MNSICVKLIREYVVCVLLFVSPHGLFSHNLAWLVQSSSNVITGTVMAKDSALLTLAVNEAVFGADVLDTVFLSRTDFNRCAAERVFDAEIGEQRVFFVEQTKTDNIYSISSIGGEIGLPVLTDSLVYQADKYAYRDAVTAMKEYKQIAHEICFAQQEGKKRKFASFVKRSAMHEKLYCENSLICSHSDSIAQSIPEIVVASKKMNVLFVGVKNYLELAVPSRSVDDYSICMSVGKLNIQNGILTAQFEKEGTAEICIFRDHKKKYCQQFRVIDIWTKPAVRVFGQKGGLISSKKLAAARSLNASYENMDWDMRLKIISYRMSIHKNNGSVIEFSAKGHKISDEMKAALKLIKDNEKVYFSNILVCTLAGKLTECDILMFKVRDADRN